MTTFTTEDREWAYWNTYNCPKYSDQTEIKFFWPLTEQIDLELDFTGCENLKYTYSGITGSSGQTFTFDAPTWTTGINPSLSVSAVDSVGELKIGGISIGLDTKPNIMRRALHKLLGFDWKDK